jgi:ribosomal protein S18 acetylase RimI-like enzyme
MRIVQANQEHVHPVIGLLSECISDLRRRGIYQWDDVYPNLDTVAKDVADRTLYVALQADRCLGAVCLSEEQDEAYQEVNWVGHEPVLVIHRLCVAPAHQGRGIASRLMDFAEAFAEEKGYASIRLDAYTGNERAVELYERRGYTVVGQVFFPRRELPFYCMEKIVRDKNAP